MSQPSKSETETSKVVKSATVISIATMLSRVLGLVRDSVTAAIFGAGGSMDAFLVAFRLPNMLRSLLAEGSLSISFIPVFIEVSEKEGEARANQMARAALTLLAIVLLAVVILGVLLAPLVVNVVALGYSNIPEKYDLTVYLTRIVFPFIGFVSITAFASGILNARSIFFIPALAPVVLNLAIIATVLLMYKSVDPPITSLAYGVIIGGILQLVLQIPSLRKTGFRYKPDFSWKDPAIHKIFLLMAPAIFGVAVYQFNVLASTFFASWLPDGSITYLYLAERVFQLPLGVFAVSMGMATLTSLSKLAANEEWHEFGQTLSSSIRILWLVILPATAGIMFLSEPICGLLFHRGSFSVAMTQSTAEALRFYALALMPVATSRVIAQGFYAVKDTKTPVKGAFFSFVINLAASVALIGPLKHSGLALATAISSFANLGYLSFAYKNKTGEYPFVNLLKPILLTLGSTLAMGAFLGGCLLAFKKGLFGGSGEVLRGVYLFATIIGGMVVYGVTARALGLKEIDRIAKRFLRLGK